MPENIAYEPSSNNLTTNSGLLLHHLQQLTEASGLNHEMIVERGYRSVTIRVELSEILPDGLSHRQWQAVAKLLRAMLYDDWRRRSRRWPL